MYVNPRQGGLSMNPVKLFVYAALIGLVSNVGIAQQLELPIARVPDANNLRFVSEGPQAPLPPAGQPQQVPQLVQEPTPLTGMALAELEEMAVRCNPTVAQAANRVEAARGRCVQVGLYPNPVAGYIGAEIGNEGQGGQQGSFVGQEIVTAGKLRLNQSIAQQEIRQAEWAWQAQRQRVLTDVRRSFYDVLVAQRAMELTEQLLRIGEEGVRSIESLMKAKEVARADALQAHIEAESARVLLERARNRHAAAWRHLAAVVGAANMPPRPLAGEAWDDLAVLTWEDTYSRLLAESPQLASARAGVARAQASVARECAQRVPNIDLQMAVQYDNATRDTFATVQAGVPMPIFNRNQGNIRRAQAELMAAQNDVQRVQLDLQQRLASVFEQYTSARYQVEKYSRDILPSAKASLDLANKGYRQGEYNYLSLLTAQRTYFQTNLIYLEALRELRTASTAIEGNLLSGSLQAGEAGDRTP
jgi:outer membrane protein, heavy metal efflux system